MNNTDHYNDLLRQVPNTHKTLRIKIMHNIGILFVKMGQYNDACSSFEWIMSEQVREARQIHNILSHVYYLSISCIIYLYFLYH